MDMYDDLWTRYQEKSLKEILEDLYRETVGKSPTPELSKKDLLLSIFSFYKALLDNMPGSVYWIDEKDRYIGGNKTVLNMLGLESSSGLKGKTSKEIGEILNLTEAQYKDVLSNNKQIFRTGKPIVNKQELPFTDTQGKKWIQLTNKVPIRNKVGHIDILLGISLDITERVYLLESIVTQKETLNEILKKLYHEIIGKPLENIKTPEEMFKKICDFHRGLLNHMPGIVFWMDENDKYLGCNQSLLDMYGLKEHSEFIGLSTPDIAKTFNWPEKQYLEIIADNKNVFQTGQPLVNKQEAPFTDTQGKTWVQLTNKVPIKNEQGNVDLLLGVSIDISDRIKLMEELEEQKENAEAANQSKTSFLENMRHDIRTPLSGILGCCDLILQHADNKEKVVENAESVRAATYSFLHFMNRMLEMIRIADGNVPNRIDRFETITPIRRVVDLLRATASTKNIKLTFDYDYNIPEVVCCNLDRFFKIFYEPLKNAVTFTQESGSVQLVIELVNKEPQKAIIQIDIKDTGIGMSAEQIRKIFVPFAKAIPSYRGINDGMGIGLTMTKQFVDDFGGEVYIAESIIGEGTTVRINLPLTLPLTNDRMGLVTDFDYLQESFGQIALQKSNVASSNTADNEYRLLVVEDNSMASKIAKSILNRLDFAVDIAPDGNTAVSLAKANQYELIFMDVGLPDIDGCEATRQIRTHEWKTNTHTPIIALTAHIDVESKQMCIESGMDAVLSKPLEFEKASDILHAFIPHVYLNAEVEEASSALDTEDLIDTTAPIIDFNECATLVGSSEDIARDVISMLITSFETEVPLMNNAFGRNDWSSLRALSHKMKGSACYSGTPRLLAACIALERAIRNEKTESYEALFQQLQQEVENCKTEFTKL